VSGGSDQPATAAVYHTRSDAEIARAKLAGMGIDAAVIADDEGGLNPGFYARYGVRVIVPGRRASEARAALGFGGLRLAAEAEAAMRQHARFCAPAEACGLFAVDDDAVTMVYCLTNSAASTVAYTIDPAESFHVWRHAERNGWSIGGVFHSHPGSQAVPSRADLEGLDPAWVSIIVGGDEVRAYRIRDGLAIEVAVERE
jgi:proteasome lid subunit RPN8/RPN11